jgi:gamma-glutamylcyclotransferase (GGCT)/AIG2-like uncharacterized protein YtfP
MIFFSYGTLLDPEYQRELFGRSVPTRPATLDGWLAVFTEGGFLTIVRRRDARVAGALVSVDERELAICDAWEDVPLYERVDVTVTSAGERVRTWAYVRAVAGGEPAPPGMLARADRPAVIEAIRRFRAGEIGSHTG